MSDLAVVDFRKFENSNMHNLLSSCFFYYLFLAIPKDKKRTHLQIQKNLKDNVIVFKIGFSISASRESKKRNVGYSLAIFNYNFSGYSVLQ